MQVHLSDSGKDKETKSWIGSIITLGALVGSLVGGPVAQTIGRKYALVLDGILFTFGWYLLTIANSVTVILIGRAITGFSTGLVAATAPM